VIQLCLTLFLLSIQLYAEIDNDLDGVDDTQDRCPNTSFEKTVDLYGCPEDEYYLGTLNIELLYSYINHTKSSNKSFYFDYNYDKLLLSLSHTYYDNSITSSNLFIGTLIGYKNILSKIYIGKEDKTTILKNTYEYIYKNYVTYFEINYHKDQTSYISYSIGLSKNMKNSTLSLYYINSGYTNTFINLYQDIQTVYTYALTQKFYTKVELDYTLTEDTLYNISLSIGAYFE